MLENVDRGRTTRILIMTKTKTINAPEISLLVNTLNLEIGSETKISIVLFSISPEIKEAAIETERPIKRIGQIRLKCLPESKPSRVLKELASKPKALFRSAGKLLIISETLAPDFWIEG